ncbi:MAG: hypothetical protein JNL22_06385 [Bacteroidales bacterium]|jgi:hypothetical protein|nr:hypothetical protein [Bacteroidales bacterium]
MWKHDNFFVGAFSALILSLLTSILLIAAGPWLYRLFSDFLPQNKLLLLALLPSLLLMRQYFRKYRFEKSGMGALSVLFLLIVLYFVLLHNKPVSVFFINL